MPIDSFTVLLLGFCIKLMLGALFTLFWLKDRAAPWFAWWGAAFFLGSGTAALFMFTGPGESYLAIVAGNVILMTTFTCCWQGARTFNRKPALWWPVFGAPAIWLVACLIPAFMSSLTARIVLSSAMVAPLLALSAITFWHGRAEQLHSRWPVIVLFSSFALLFAIRIPLVDVLPFPVGAMPLQPGWLGGFNLIMFTHMILLTVLLVSMSKERLELEQRIKAQTDSLTGALNRRAFMLRGERMLLRHRYEHAPLCLLFLDIDHFKLLNDRLGHSAGDDVLVNFVGVVNTCIRPTDFLFRIGGEEFCCLLPYTLTADAQCVAERIRHHFEVMPTEVAETSVKATVSVGIASTETFGYDLETLMRHADTAVYMAKRLGRNRIITSTPGEPDNRTPAIAAGAGEVLAEA